MTDVKPIPDGHPWMSRCAFLLLTWLLLTAQAPDDAKVFYEIAQRAVNPNQVAELVGPLGPVGVLADGTNPESYELPSGPTVPARLGTQPLEYKPLAHLAARAE
jgi:hypothetical protein